MAAMVVEWVCPKAIFPAARFLHVHSRKTRSEAGMGRRTATAPTARWMLTGN
jgi:hypothetical protein